MDVPMTTMHLTHRRAKVSAVAHRGATALAAGLLAGAAMVALASPATADPTPAPTTGPVIPGGQPVTPAAGTITWSAQPSTRGGPDKRSSYVYNNLPPLTIVHDYVAVTNYSKLPVAFRIYASDAYNTQSG